MLIEMLSVFKLLSSGGVMDRDDQYSFSMIDQTLTTLTRALIEVFLNDFIF
jgi:hypothetical protein